MCFEGKITAIPTPKNNINIIHTNIEEEVPENAPYQQCYPSPITFCLLPTTIVAVVIASDISQGLAKEEHM
jgi:hypothetical protein